MPRYVICYDIASDSRRRKVADCLDSYGDRVQGSVFELLVGQRLFRQCVDQIKTQIDPQADRVAVYVLCATCETHRFYWGGGDAVKSVGEESVFIA